VSTLANLLSAKREQIEKNLGSIIASLAQTATELDLPSVKSDVEKTYKRLMNDQFQLLVAGRFKNGKSTLMNVLVGKATRDIEALRAMGGPMPMDDLPCTATLSRLQYSETPYVKAWLFREDGALVDVVGDADATKGSKFETWTFDRYRRDATITRGTESNEDMFRTIQEFEIGLPAELTSAGVILIDSPGTSEDPRRTEITRRAASEADAAIIVFRHDALAGLDELSFLAELEGPNSQVFKVVNLFHGRTVDARLKAEALRRLAKDSPDPERENPEAHDIYFVDVKRALDSTLANDASSVQASGIVAFETRLAKFLLNNKYLTKLKSARKKVDISAATILGNITREESAARLEREDLQKRVQECRRDLAVIRSRRANVERVIQRAGDQAERAAVSSYREMINDLILSIEDEFSRKPIPTLQSLGGQLKAPFQTKKAVGEAVDILQGLVSERMRSWAENDETKPGLQRQLKPTFDALTEDLRVELHEIDAILKSIQLKFTPATTGGAPVLQETSLFDRLTSAGLGFILLGGPLGMVAAQGGWRSLVGGTIGGVATVIGAMAVTAVFGVALAPAAVAAAIAAAFIGGSTAGAMFDIEKRMKKKALEAVMPTLQRMRNDPTVEADLTSRVGDAVMKLKLQVAGVVNEVIGQEEEQLANIERTANAEIDTKAERITKLHDARDAVKAAKANLAKLITEAEDAVS